MRLIAKRLACSLLLAFTCAWAHGETGAGAAIYTTCASCHGSDGGGNGALKAPRLNHLGGTYLATQLQKFKAGVRGGPGAGAPAMQMAGIAATLPDNQAVADVVAYIDTLEGGPSAVTVTGDLRLGGDYYNQFCGACHGARAEGNPALNAPRLAGSDDWYLLAQLDAFRVGNRGTHPQDKTGRQMRAMAGVLPGDQARADVVAFIRSLADPG